jgi:hypothetical protein
VEVVERRGLGRRNVEVDRHSVVGWVEQELRSVVSDESILADQSVLEVGGLLPVAIGNDVVGGLALVLRFDNDVHVGEVGERVCAKVRYRHRSDLFFLFLFLEVSRRYDDVDVIAALGVLSGEVDLPVVVELHLHVAAYYVDVYYDLLVFGAGYQVAVYLLGSHHVRQRLSFLQVHLGEGGLRVQR